MKAAIKEPKVKSDAKAKPFTTNVPVNCNVCEVDTFLWKYCITAHFAMVRGGLGIPKDSRGKKKPKGSHQKWGRSDP